MLTTDTFEFIGELDRQSDISTLTESFQKLIRKFGLAYFMVGDPRPPQPDDGYLWATTWPAGWLERWISRGYLQDDPIIKKLRLQTTPVRWGPKEGANDAAGTRILEEAGEFRLKAGVAVPVYNRDGLYVVSIGAERYDLGKDDEICLHMAAHYFHARLGRIRARNAPSARGPKLTPRERECLSWVASGKTDWEISQILNIAEQTVHEYVQNALIKLNATTRAQAVAIAIVTRQILY
ncbi:MAG: LuxR family transcriptional regulator [Proteobacteria bacterium]|nr:LuxR family transcriptional regulator [Pseudomonadota bacterium]